MRVRPLYVYLAFFHLGVGCIIDSTLLDISQPRPPRAKEPRQMPRPAHVAIPAHVTARRSRFLLLARRYSIFLYNLFLFHWTLGIGYPILLASRFRHSFIDVLTRLWIFKGIRGKCSSLSRCARWESALALENQKKRKRHTHPAEPQNLNPNEGGF